MKKLKKIAVFLLLLISVILLTGCGNKTKLSANDFKTKMENKDFTIVDVTEQFTGQGVSVVYLAHNDNYQIEFYQCETEELAKSSYALNKTTFENNSSGSKSYSESNIGNYSKYTQTSGDTYSVVVRVEDTFIYVNTNKSYKKDINKILKDLGY